MYSFVRTITLAIPLSNLLSHALAAAVPAATTAMVTSMPKVDMYKRQDATDSGDDDDEDDADDSDPENGTDPIRLGKYRCARKSQKHSLYIAISFQSTLCVHYSSDSDMVLRILWISVRLRCHLHAPDHNCT